MMKQGIKVKVDLIIGLPGDTVESVRRGLRYLHDSGLCSDLQVFNLAVLPGTAFRHEAVSLGLIFQPRPPYYVLRTPTLAREDLFGLMQEAQDLFGIEFDAQPRPVLEFGVGQAYRVRHVDLDGHSPVAAMQPSQAFTLWFHSAHFDRRSEDAARLIREVLDADPFTTLQVILEPDAGFDAHRLPDWLGPRTLAALVAACQSSPTYLDKFYAMQPGRANGAKRFVVLLPLACRPRLPPGWVEDVADYATFVWRGAAGRGEEESMVAHEFAWNG